ncbi:MAG: peptidylprolyl isomerase [Chthoniobacterales bacterium]
MNRIQKLLLTALALGSGALVSQALTVKPNVGPVVSAQIPNYDQYLLTTRVIDMSPYFSDPDASAAAKMVTPFGSIKVALDGAQAPQTVANFLNYITSDRYFTIDPTNGDRASMFFHRSVSNFVLQGGGFLGTVNPNGTGALRATAVAAFPPVQNEPFISNTRGTIAMAKLSGDPNSATSQWFINLRDNGGGTAQLDTQNGGFTVFGHVVGDGMNVVDSIAAQPTFNFGGAFDTLPVRDYTLADYNSGKVPKIPNLVSVPEFIPASPLSYSATSDNPNVATASASEGNLLVTAFQLGTANITVTGFDLDGAGPVSQTFNVNVVTAPGRIRNISTRANFPAGNEMLTAGFIVRGGSAKRLVARAVAVPGAGNFDNPTLELLDANGQVIASNDDWGTALNKQELIDLQIAPPSDKDSAILVDVPSSATNISYTARMRSANGHTGVGLVEIFDIDSGAGATFRNISTVGPVGTGVNELVAGFIVRGSDSRRVIVRGLGPSLGDHGIDGSLQNPTLVLRDGNHNVIAMNDDWQSNPDAGEIQTIGLQPPRPEESAVIITLPEGSYTASVSGVGGTTGVGQVEIFQVQ